MGSPKDDTAASTAADVKKAVSNPGHDGSDEQRKSLEEALPSELVSAGSQHLQRRLGGKEVQLIALGGAIGTCKRSDVNITYMYESA